MDMDISSELRREAKILPSSHVTEVWSAWSWPPGIFLTSSVARLMGCLIFLRNADLLTPTPQLPLRLVRLVQNDRRLHGLSGDTIEDGYWESKSTMIGGLGFWRLALATPPSTPQPINSKPKADSSKTMPYSTTTYLLDRANIHDTVTKLYLLTDLQAWDRLQNEVPAISGIILDYSKLFGSPPTEHTPESLVKTWKATMEKMSATQHVITGLVIDLPQPGEGVEEPVEVKVMANVTALLVREGLKGGDRTRNGGRAELVLVKEVGEEGNPWRVSKLTACERFWKEGNLAVFKD